MFYPRIFCRYSSDPYPTDRADIDPSDVWNLQANTLFRGFFRREYSKYMYLSFSARGGRGEETSIGVMVDNPIIV